MKTTIRMIVLVLGLVSQGQAQDRYVLRDSLMSILSNTDIDTLIWLFSPSAVPAQSSFTSDTTKANRTALIPPSYARSAGSFDLWLNRHNLSNAADSFRVYYFTVDPFSGRPAINDSTFVIGTASTFATIPGSRNRGARYTISINPNFGVWLVIRQGDLTPVRTKVRATLIHTQ